MGLGMASQTLDSIKRRFAQPASITGRRIVASVAAENRAGLERFLALPLRDGTSCDPSFNPISARGDVKSSTGIDFVACISAAAGCGDEAIRASDACVSAVCGDAAL